MCFGCPSVARRVGGIPEVVADDETGLLVDSAAAAALARAVESLMASPSKRREFGLAAQAWAKEKFSAAAIVPLYEGLYRRTLERPGGRGGI